MAKKAAKKRSMLDEFVQHQDKALEESGKALAGLLPKDFRDHAANALDEATTGWKILFDGVIDRVESGLDKLRSEPKAKDRPSKEKVQVEVD
jgi:hypothetical protein